MDLKTELAALPGLITKSGGINPNFLRPKSKFLASAMYARLQQMPGQSDSERLYQVLVALPSACKVCGQPTKFINFRLGYREYCSNQCQTQSADRRERMQKTMLHKYGVEHALQHSTFRQKVKSTNIGRFGRDSNNQATISDESMQRLEDPQWLANEHTVKKRPLYSIAADLGVTAKTVGNYLRRHRMPITRHWSQSGAERELAKYIKNDLGLEATLGSRSIIPPYEIDIFIPSCQLAIEFNGRYWHAPAQFGSTAEWLQYHQRKEQLCARQGIALLHLWEDYQDHRQLITSALYKKSAINDYTAVLAEVKWVSNPINKYIT